MPAPPLAPARSTPHRLSAVRPRLRLRSHPRVRSRPHANNFHCRRPQLLDSEEGADNKLARARRRCTKPRFPTPAYPVHQPCTSRWCDCDALARRLHHARHNRRHCTSHCGWVMQPYQCCCTCSAWHRSELAQSQSPAATPAHRRLHVRRWLVSSQQVCPLIV